MRAWVLVLLAGCSAAITPSDAPDLIPIAVADDLGAAPDLAVQDGGLGTLRGAVMLTYYWVAMQTDYTGVNDTDVCDANADVLATVPADFERALRLEGTGKLSDGRLLNVARPCVCSAGMTTCYVVLDPQVSPWGLGVQSRPLVPFRSVAVDRDFVPYGTRLYVPELDGVQMPSSHGFVHDGCLIAADTGGGIDGAHIDFFAAEKANYRALDGLLRLDSVTLYADPPRCP